MKINQQELEAAIETISEGGTALGVSCEDVYERMAQSDSTRNEIFKQVHSWQITCGLINMFESEFEIHCKELLLDALRAKMENDNGL